MYHVFSNTAYDKDIAGANSDTNVTSVAVAGSSGSSKVLAIGNLTRDVYRSTDDGASWLASKKDPSGAAAGVAYVVMADDYYESGKAWVAKGGANGGISLSSDSGVLWTQISMIDTEINTINTLGFSPNYASDSTMFMVATNAAGTIDNLWRYDGPYWERVHDRATFAMAALNTIRFSPEYASDSAVFIAATATPKIWRSTDGGMRFIPQIGAPTAFSGSWIVIDPVTLIVGNAANATISKNNGTTWSNKGLSGATGPVLSFAKSLDYANDSTLLAGDSAGQVYRSTDSGGSWSGIPAGVATAGGGALSVAFDADYASNSTVYAADATSDAVYRLVIGTDTAWKRIDGLATTTWPGASTAAGTVTGIAAAPDGALYVADASTTVILRSINPTASTSSTHGVYFEPVNYGFTGMPGNLRGVWLTASSNTVWTLESAAGASRIWTYTDNLPVVPGLAGPGLVEKPIGG